MCPRLAVRSGTCRQEQSNDSQGERIVQGATGCESVSSHKVFLILGTRGLGSALQGNKSQSKGLRQDEQVVLSDVSGVTYPLRVISSRDLSR